MSGGRAGEEALVRAIRALTGTAGDTAGVRVGIGDDCAVLEPTPGAALLATTDLLLEDVHFRRRWAEPADIGWKALAVNLSDIAAMGGRPRWALVALACPEGTPTEEIEAFYEGALALARSHGVAIVGGDTSVSPDGWLINVTLLGDARDAPPPLDRPPRRRHRRDRGPRPLGSRPRGAGARRRPAGVDPARLAEVTARSPASRAPRPRGRVAGGRGRRTAMMDLSDGLGLDLPRLLVASGTGARVDVDRLPVDGATRAVAAALGADPTAWATGGGEDYELLLTCEPAALARLQGVLADRGGARLTPIGEVTAGSGSVRWISGGREVTVARGYEHFAGRPAASGAGA